ncbi:phosphoribosyltransferase [Streptomyces globisporus]|uniref:phosphoribosyltransferase n=1 Tax=Streptomyces globisporus TaxID=1908 RepID=UPI0036DD2A70
MTLSAPGPPGARVFQGKRVWAMSQDAFLAAAALIAAHEKRFAPDLVIGLARGGVPLARETARILRIPGAEIRAQHNVSDLVGIQATGEVEVDEAALRAAAASARRVLIVDDICGSGATLTAVTHLLTDSGVEARTAVLCRNDGARFPVLDTWVWPVADWVSFPWEAPPPPGSTPLPRPCQVHTAQEAP